MQRRVWAFFALTLFISWSTWLSAAAAEAGLLPFSIPLAVQAVGIFGPALAALIVAARVEGREGLRRLWRRLVRWRVGWQWYALALLGPALLFAAAIAIGALLGLSVDLSRPAVLDLVGDDSLSPWLLLPPLFLYTLITVAGEEIGWRGYALPHLLDQQSPLTASLIVGLVWGLWHVPLASLPETGAGIVHIPIFWFMVDILGASILYTWIFRRSGRSLLIIVLLHTANNVAASYLPILPPAAPLNVFLINVALKWGLVALALGDWKRQARLAA